MYDRTYPGRRGLKPNFEEGVKGFITWAFAQECCLSEGGVRCPCLKCECRPIISDPEEVERHLKRRGFIKNYWVWTYNGEQLPSNVQRTTTTHASSSRSHMEHREEFSLISDMVGDAFGVNVTYDEPQDFDQEELPNEEAQKFYQLLQEMNTPLFEGSSDSKLSMCVRLLAAKSNWNVPDQCLEFFAKMMLDATPTKDNLPTSFYDAKRLVSKLGLEVRKIDCCTNGCMLFYDNEFGTNDGSLEECKFCKSPRYKVRSKAINRVTDGGEDDFYGTITHIYELVYNYLDCENKVVLFYCDWYDISARGTKIDKKYNTVEIRMDRRYKEYDPFIMSHIVRQVYYVPYPSTQPRKRGWCVVIKTKPLGHIEADDVVVEDVAYQDDETSQVNDVIEVEQITSLCDTVVEGHQVDASTLLTENDVDEECEEFVSEDSIRTDEDFE
ncbi:hypothetical protein KIW84_066259 [Lathyrus oleraceus]|uniref:Transposase-associated domain-containing protein n=1 Tax=Pisum sativum TaxID=3888 RepID=A0A9D4WHJ5_PEA|nr:hypothetical protein KIW84_066259 [Pisum sativum]